MSSLLCPSPASLCSLHLSFPHFSLLSCCVLCVQKAVAYCGNHHAPGMRFDSSSQLWVKVSYEDRLPPAFKRMIAMRKELDTARLVLCVCMCVCLCS